MHTHTHTHTHTHRTILAQPPSPTHQSGVVFETNKIVRRLKGIVGTNISPDIERLTETLEELSTLCDTGLGFRL